MNPQLPGSFNALDSELKFVANALNAMPHEELWEARAQFYRESLQHMIEILFYMLVDERFIRAPGNPNVLGLFAEQLAHYTPKPSDVDLRPGDHRSYAVRHLYSQLTHLLELERRWTLKQPYVTSMIEELTQTSGYYKGRIVMVRRALRRFL